ncbi:MAG: sulfite exporter TauE/SafE family protein [Rhodospirillales bacterium]|nr:sulfite exporter TauE/SafE family protein [Rhodospirillales bacterium]
MALAADADTLGLAFAMLLAGLAGGFAHCAGMCGPFVVAQTLGRGDGPGIGRLKGLLLAPYHLGRATSYVALGAVFGALGGAVASLPGLRSLLAVFLVVAAIMFVFQALGRAPSTGGTAGVWLGARVRPLVADPTGLRGYALGIALGFLPCGFLYGAFAAAAGSGDALRGAAAMSGFVAGTLPALLVVQFAGAMAARRWRNALGALAPLLMLFNAAALLMIAWRFVS